MKYIPDSLSQQHKQLALLLKKPANAKPAIECFLSLHAQLQPRAVSGLTQPTLVDDLLSGLRPADFAVMPTKKDETLAWIFWHMARLEDLTMNLLLARGEQVYTPEWRARIGVHITDTGNALSDSEILDLSREADIPQLLAYREAVAHRTREIVSTLTPADLPRPVDRADLDRLYAQGGVTDAPESFSLLDYWSKKTVATLLLMPPTRDPMMHLNAAHALKSRL